MEGNSPTKSIITNNYIITNPNEIVFVEVIDKDGFLYGKGNEQMTVVSGFDEMSFMKNGFIRISNSFYVNPLHILSLNTKTAKLELVNNIRLKYQKKFENQLQDFLFSLL
jgi:DNA-binding LytR/AlgR family response regulator